MDCPQDKQSMLQCSIRGVEAELKMPKTARQKEKSHPSEEAS
jgi:hypothetical protein